MLARIYSPVVCIETPGKLVAVFVLMLSQSTLAQSGYYTDDSTGIVYQKVTRTIDRPVVQTKVEQQQQTVFRPQTITETSPQTNTIYTPVLEYKWEPRVHGRWNPFQRSTVAYHHVPQTRWEARNQVVQRTSTRTEWVAEKRVIDVPRQFVRMERKQEIDYRPVGRVAPNSSQIASGPNTGSPNINNEIASRLRPIDANTRIQPLNSTSVATTATAAARSVGPFGNVAQQRSSTQNGLPVTNLSVGMPTRPMPPSNSSSGIATLPAPPVFR
ncbi:MAG: hypothetical protein P8L85_16510 [Rubripirellula sp.]|nr:hypothetical protein [Rubripirellula sp.]